MEQNDMNHEEQISNERDWNLIFEDRSKLLHFLIVIGDHWPGRSVITDASALTTDEIKDRSTLGVVKKTPWLLPGFLPGRHVRHASLALHQSNRSTSSWCTHRKTHIEHPSQSNNQEWCKAHRPCILRGQHDTSTSHVEMVALLQQQQCSAFEFASIRLLRSFIRLCC